MSSLGRTDISASSFPSLSRWEFNFCLSANNLSLKRQPLILV